MARRTGQSRAPVATRRAAAVSDEPIAWSNQLADGSRAHSPADLVTGSGRISPFGVPRATGCSGTRSATAPGAHPDHHRHHPAAGPRARLTTTKPPLRQKGQTQRSVEPRPPGAAAWPPGTPKMLKQQDAAASASHTKIAKYRGYLSGSPIKIFEILMQLFAASQELVEMLDESCRIRRAVETHS
jgi:hypothetical protein